MDDKDFDTTFQKLSEQVNKFSVNNNYNPQIKSPTTLMQKISEKKKYYYYLGVPIGFIILLYLCEPKFVMEEVTKEDNIVIKKVSLKKLILSSIVLSTILIVAMLFIDIYNRKST